MLRYDMIVVEISWWDMMRYDMIVVKIWSVMHVAIMFVVERYNNMCQYSRVSSLDKMPQVGNALRKQNQPR